MVKECNVLAHEMLQLIPSFISPPDDLCSGLANALHI